MRLRTVCGLTGLLALMASLLPISAASAADFDVSVEDFVFVRDELSVNAGDTVTWNWMGEAPHNVTPVDDTAFEASDTITEGSFSVTFDTVGEVPYYCTIHSSPDGSEGMIGVVNVLPEGAPLPPPRPEPRPAPDGGRLPAATDNVGTALVWSSLFDDGSAPSVVLGRDDVFADSLTSGAAQGLLDAPLLLTPTDQLDQRVIDELRRLGANEVQIFGGENAISPAVEQQLRDLGPTVERIQGTTRIETANASAETFFPGATSAFLVRSDGLPGGDATQGFADSLSVGGAAAGASIPILLTQTDRLSATTTQYLMDRSIKTVYVVGGEAALAPQVVTDLEALGIEVTRVAGPTRFDTSYAVASEFYPTPPTAILVDGQGPNAWVSGFAAASAAESAPIILANGDDLPPVTLENLSFGGIEVLCGPGLAESACERAEIAVGAAQFGDPGLVLAVMNGEQEVPDTGNDSATADFFLKPTAAPDALCYEISIYGIGEPVTGAHIHSGAEGVAGDVVVPLLAPGPAPFVASCIFDLDPTLVTDILANPADYYANYHTETFPAGAVRGQLFTYEMIGIAELQPGSEVPPADVMGAGFNALVTDADDHTILAYHLNFGFAGPDQAMAGHIHEAAEGENGPVVHPLQLPEAGEEGYAGTFKDEGVNQMLVEQLLSSPSDFYVNIHTDTFPDGALRGQVFNPFGGGGPPPAFSASAPRR